MFKAMITLIQVKIINKSQININRNRSRKIDHMIIRIGKLVVHITITL